MSAIQLAHSFLRQCRRSGPLDAMSSSLRWMTITWKARNPDVQRHVARFNDFFFTELGIERRDAERVYRAAAAKVGFAAGESDSIHRLAFAALAASGFAPRTILELGTSHGETTEFLAEIFPAS